MEEIIGIMYFESKQPIDLVYVFFIQLLNTVAMRKHAYIPYVTSVITRDI